MEAGEGRVQSAVQSAGCAASSAQSMGEGGRRVGWRVGVGGSAFLDHREIGLRFIGPDQSVVHDVWLPRWRVSSECGRTSVLRNCVTLSYRTVSRRCVG